MGIFITFAYTGQISISHNNVKQLIYDADYLGINDVKEECAKFLKSSINLQNVLQIRHIAKTLHCMHLLEESNKIISANFVNISYTENYQNIAIEDLKDIITNDELCIPSEYMLFEAVMRWLLHDIDERNVHVQELLELIQFHKLNAEYLINYFFTSQLEISEDLHRYNHDKLTFR